MLDRFRPLRLHLPRFAFVHSVFFRATMIVFLCTLLVTGVLTALNYRSSRTAAYAAAHERAAMFSEKLAAAVVNPMRFGAHDRVDEIIQQYLGDSDGQSLGVLVFDSAGRDFAGLADEEVEPLMRDLLARAKETGTLAATADGMELVGPIRDSRDSLLGYIAIAWSPEQALATLNARLREALIVTAGVFILALLGAAVGFSRLIARPLVRVNHAVERVAAGDYAIDVPMRRRRDEIGTIAKALESFRASLSESAEISRQAMFNSAALEASSGALLITDTDQCILHLNAAALQFFATHAEGFRSHDPDFDPGKLIGQRADLLIPGGGEAMGSLGEEAGVLARVESQIGGRTIEIVIAPVRNAEGEIIGTVSQWSDISRDMRNITVIGAIDASQLRAEFRTDGQMTFANAHFTQLFDAAQVPPEAADLRQALQLAETGTPLFDWLAQEESFNGKLRLLLGEATFTLDAVVAPVRDREGAVQHFMMLARDSTASEAALAAAEARRAALEATQHAVVEALREGLALLSRGVLSTRIDTEFAPQYEQLRADYNVAAQNLRQAMERVVETAQAIEREARELVTAGDELNRRTEQQAATLEETAAALNEMTTSVKAAAALSAQANRMVEEAKSNAEASGSVVRDAVQAMGEIEDSSQKISKITSVIDDIAFQTNLLALNAGVEAARAGEAGRGFAVVASEVRALAQRSSEAAREIAGLISSSTAQIARGVGLVGEAGDALHGIENSVGEICHAMSEITASSQDQAAGLSEINTALTQLDQVTQHNAAMFEQTNASSHALTRDAFNLLETIGLFDLGQVSARRSPQDSEGAAPESAPKQPAPPPVVEAPVPVAAAQRETTRGALALAEDQDDWEDF